MRGTVSEDAVRTAIHRIEETAGFDWLSTHIFGSRSPALCLPWILDIDVTVKPLYGHQQGAEIGYNPQKPGRPSHVYHSYFVTNLRISLGMEVRPGNEHAAAKGRPGLWQALETTIRLSGWTRERRVVLVRESPARAAVAQTGKPRHGKGRQKLLPNAQGVGWDAQASPWSGKIAELVTSLNPQAFPTIVMP